MKCFYHHDLDGWCSAFWVHLSAGITDINAPIDFIEINYNKKFPLETIQPNEQIWIVDYSIDPTEMHKLLEITKDVTWIDHHKTAIEKYRDFPVPIRGIRFDGLSGCELTFLYIHKLTSRGLGPIKDLMFEYVQEIPRFTRLVGDWDCWRFEFGEDTKRFKTGMEMQVSGYDSNLWRLFLEKEDELIDKIIEDGKRGIIFENKLAKRLLQSYSFETELLGYKCIALNAGCCSSEYFKSISLNYEIMIAFVFDGKLWTVSLYSTKVDVSNIAKQFGGGGHKGAAGFQCKQLPFETK